MFVKKFGVALAAGLVAVACATPAALAADAVKDAEATLAKANAALEAAKAAAAAPADVASPVPDQTKADLADKKLDAQYFCAEGTEYYDMVKCADAQARLGAGSNATPDAPAVTPDTPSTAPDNSHSDTPKPATDVKAPKAKGKEGKGNLAKTGASFAPLMGAAAAIALAGGVMVARKRA